MWNAQCLLFKYGACKSVGKLQHSTMNKTKKDIGKTETKKVLVFGKHSRV